VFCKSESSVSSLFFGSDQRRFQRSFYSLSRCTRLSCMSVVMDDEFGEGIFCDPANCGGYSHLPEISEDEESGDDYQTPRPRPGNIVMEHLWTGSTQTCETSSTAASSSMSSGPAVIHHPLDLATMFESAKCDDTVAMKASAEIETRYAITERPPVEGSTLEEQIDWVFTYARRIDKPWLNFPHSLNNKRLKVKTLDFSFLIRQYLDNKSFF
jgi:hypothetical protein